MVTTPVDEKYLRGGKALMLSTFAGVDQLTLVLQAPVKKKLQLTKVAQWVALAKLICWEFEQKADLVQVFGEAKVSQNLPAGYTSGVEYGDHTFYFCVAFHPERYSMGVVVKFSAQALAYYLKAKNWQVNDFLQSVQSERYELRLSRIDFDLDFLEPNFTVNGIHKQLKNGIVEVCTEKNTRGVKSLARKPVKLKGFAVNGKIESVYLGSPASATELRIYWKGREQINRSGSHLDLALKHPNWIRFEAVLKNEYAHQLTDAILKVKNDKQLSDLILNTFIQKYYFRYSKSKKCTTYTTQIKKLISAKSSPLLPLVAEDKNLEKKFVYLLSDSGTISTLYKVLVLWGNDGLDAALKFIGETVQEWDPNDLCMTWLRRHKADTLKSYKTFDDFLRKV